MQMTVKFSLLFIVALVLSGCATTTTKNDALSPDPETTVTLEELLASGDKAMSTGDLDTAQVKYALAIERDPENIETLYKLGFIHNEKNSLPVAEGVLRRALILNPEHRGSLETLGIVLLKLERFSEAETMLDAALERRPDAWRVLNALGVIKDMQADHEQAIAYFTAAAFIVPRSAKIANNLGYSYYLKGDFDTAEEHFRDAVRLDPNYVHAWSNLGLTFTRQKRYTDANAAFSKIVKEYQAANNIGYLSMLEQDEQLARQQFRRAIDLSPAYYETANRNLTFLNNSGQALRTSKAPTDRRENLEPVPRLIIGGKDMTQDESTAQKKPPTKTAKPDKVVASKFSTSTREAQRYLNFIGFDAGVSDGRGGTKTTAAVKSFQSSYGLQVDGKLGPVTRATLDRTAIKRVQKSLLVLGYEPGTIDGQIGRLTRVAIRKYQSDKSMPVTGKLSAAVLKRLNASVNEIEAQLNSPESADYSSRS